MWMVNLTPRPLYPRGKRPRYSLDRRLGGPQNRSGHSGGEEKNSQTPPGIEPSAKPDRLARSHPISLRSILILLSHLRLGRPSDLFPSVFPTKLLYEGASKSFRTGRLDRELQMAQLSATRCSCIAFLWVSLVSFAAITLCVASQWVFMIVVYFVIESVRILLDTLSYVFLISN
jgi:hypothetical protein